MLRTKEMSGIKNINVTFEEVLDNYIVPSALVTVIGLIFNLLSLSYFITQRGKNIRASSTESLNRGLFVILNISDICVCIILTTTIIVYVLDDRDLDLFSMALDRAFSIALECTGFTTCLFGMMRVFSILLPNYKLKIKLIIASVVSFVVFLILLIIISDTLKFQELRFMADFVIMISLLVIVIFSNTLCIVKLSLSPQVAKWKWEVTITIGILSVIYCVLNIGMIVYLGFIIFVCDYNVDRWCRNPNFEATSAFILLPLNSACNPIVYFIRNRGMRNYVNNIWRRLWGKNIVTDNSLRRSGTTCYETASGE